MRLAAGSEIENAVNFMIDRMWGWGGTRIAGRGG